MKRLAIFDLDYTLTRRGTWGRFCAMCLRDRKHLWPEFVARAAWMQLRYRLGQVPRIAVKTAMMEVCMTGRTRAELRALADEFAETEVRGGLREQARGVLEAHREAGDTLMIASAAVDLLVEPIARRLEVADWVATEMAWCGEGRLLGHFGSANCYGAEKKRRVVEFLRDTGRELKQSDTYVTMYSDSCADMDLLTFADDGVAVTHCRRLGRLAPSLGLRIEDWNRPAATGLPALATKGPCS